MSPARNWGTENAHDFVSRSAASPAIAIIANTTYRLRGTRSIAGRLSGLSEANDEFIIASRKAARAATAVQLATGAISRRSLSARRT
jgi:hypothetical protein